MNGDTVQSVLFVGRVFQSAISLIEDMLDATGARPLYFFGIFFFFAVVFLIGPLVPRENLSSGSDRSSGNKSSRST